MITGVAFVPQAPALVPDLGRGLDAELGAVRAACRTAIRRVATSGTSIVVVGTADELTGFGPYVDAATVGEWLVADAVGPRADVVHVRPKGEPDDLTGVDLHGEQPVALVVAGDGSASRSEKAPGHLHPRAEAMDAAVAQMLREGRGDGLHYPALDTDPGLLVGGAAAWAAVAWHVEATEWDAELLYDDAPFGVGYFVASWLPHAEH